VSKTNAPAELFPTVPAPDSEPSSKCKAIPAFDKGNSCLTADKDAVFEASTAALRAFFDLLDQWDRNDRGE
jgi:hypothetical protein